jgi:hypothetical protein
MSVLPRLAILGMILLEAGCGLPDAYYLQPPALTGTPPTGAQLNQPFGLTGSSRTNDINVTFTGYELYYKCYGSVDQAAITADQNYGSSSYSYTDLLQNGFHRVCRGPGSGGSLAVDSTPSTANAPLIDVQRIDPSNLGATFTIKIIVADLLPPSFAFASAGSIPVTYFEYLPPSATTPTAGWEIRRYAQADSSLGPVCKTFAPNPSYPGITSPANWSVSDVDMTSAIWNEVTVNPNSGQIYVMLYAVSYGIGIDGAFRESSPTWLGYTLITVN